MTGATRWTHFWYNGIRIYNEDNLADAGGAGVGGPGLEAAAGFLEGLLDSHLEGALLEALRGRMLDVVVLAISADVLGSVARGLDDSTCA